MTKGVIGRTRLQRVGRIMTRTIITFLAGMLLILLTSSAGAQQGWLVTAGKGWGPLYLGMTEQNPSLS